MIPEVPNYMSEDEGKIFKKHFLLRDEMEKKFFASDFCIKDIELPKLEVTKETLNDEKTKIFIQKLKPDFIILYGPSLLDREFIRLFTGKIFNLHGGLSPWYKGAATMFWPFYFLEPNFVGTTLHYITEKIDGGNIIHQSVPKLEYGDSMHQTACKAIVKAWDDLKEIVKKLEQGADSQGVPQKRNGKLFLTTDFRAEHLRLVYELFEDKIIDLYLDKKINVNHKPDLIRLF